jgi:CheY-like chemotaxis protein
MKKILVIDDDEVSRTTICEILKLKCFDVLAADRAALGFTLAITKKPDLIICDLEILDDHELMVFKDLRKNPVTAKIPVFWLTWKTGDELAVKAEKIGVNACLTKPITVAKFFQCILICLNLSVVA